jgi:uncharacterized protein (TIGR03083 family)
MAAIYSHQRCCDLASAEIARFAAVIRGGDPATPVLTCAPWTLADLIQHIGHIHRWAAAMVAERSPTRHSRKKAELPLPADPATWPDWLAEAETLLVPVLRAADPDARRWAWGPDKHVRFWSRRMVHETAVHRVDAELALGIQPRVDPAAAVDGVEEFLENLPRSRSLRATASSFGSSPPTGPTGGRSSGTRRASTGPAAIPRATRRTRPARSPCAPAPPSCTCCCGDGGRAPTPATR